MNKSKNYEIEHGINTVNVRDTSTLRKIKLLKEKNEELTQDRDIWKNKSQKYNKDRHNQKYCKERLKKQMEANHVIKSNNEGKRMMKLRMNCHMKIMPNSTEYQKAFMIEMMDLYPETLQAMKLYFKPQFEKMLNHQITKEAINPAFCIAAMIAKHITVRSNGRYDSNRILTQYERDPDSRELAEIYFTDTAIIKNKSPTSKVLRQAHTLYIKYVHH